MVSWIRSADLQILTAGAHVFTTDARFAIDFQAAAVAEEEEEAEADPNALDDGQLRAAPLLTETSWPLTIRGVRASDVGQYECQVNTEPKIKGNVTLVVHGE